MYCNNCGTKLIDGAQFCESCGTQLKNIDVAMDLNFQTKEQNDTVNDNIDKMLEDIDNETSELIKKQNKRRKILKYVWIAIYLYSVADAFASRSLLFFIFATIEFIVVIIVFRIRYAKQDKKRSEL